jgi:hypothetical protein
MSTTPMPIEILEALLALVCLPHPPLKVDFPTSIKTRRVQLNSGMLLTPKEEVREIIMMICQT